MIAGLSGAGRSQAADILEDLGWFVIDNLPPGLLFSLAEEAGRVKLAANKVAAVVDVRSLAFTSDLNAAIEELVSRSIGVRVLFPQLDRVVFRVDVGFPLTRPLPSGASPVTFFSTFGQAF